MAERSAPVPSIRVPFRGGGFAPRQYALMAVVFFIALIGFWQLASTLRWVSHLFLPGPLRIIEALRQLIVSGELAGHLAASLARIAGGWCAGVVAGVLFGVLIGLFSAWRSCGVPLISALFPIPKIALLPLFILWLGIGELSKVVTIALGVFYPVAIGTYAGIDNVPRNLIRMGQSFGMPMHRIVWTIIVPGMLPSVLAALRISTSIAFILMVSAEMIGAEQGLGTLLLASGNLMQTDRLMAAIVVVALLGLSVSAVLTLVEKKLLGWR